MIALGAPAVAAAVVATMAGVAAQVPRPRLHLAAALLVVATAAAIGVLRPSTALLDVIGPAAWVWVGVTAAQRFGRPRLGIARTPIGAVLGGALLGGWVTSAAIVGVSRDPRRAARLASTAWLASSVSPVGNAIGWTSAHDTAYLATLLPIAAICVVLLRPRRLAFDPTVVSAAREPVLGIAALVAMLVHGSGVAWHLGVLAAEASPLEAYTVAVVAGSVADPAVGAMIVDRASALGPTDARPAVLAARVGLACAPGPIGVLLWHRFGRDALRSMPWVLLPAVVGAAWIGLTA